MHSPLFIKGSGFTLASKRIAGKGKLIITARAISLKLIVMAYYRTPIQRQPLRLRQFA